MNANLAFKPLPPRTRRPSYWSTLLPEGPAVFILLLLTNLAPAFATQRAGWDHLITPVGFISIVAFISGVIMARAGVLDSISHIVSVVLGSAVSFVFVLAAADQFGVGLASRIKPVFWHVRDWYFGTNNPQQNDDIVLSLLLGLIVWMLAYLSAWVLFRRGWLMMAILLPGLLLLVNLGYAPDPESGFSVAYLAAAIPLAARYHLFKKQISWSRYQVAGSRSLGLKFLSVGAVLAILVTSIGWNAPDSVSQESVQPLVGELGEQIESARRNATEWLSRSDSSKSGTESGNAFSDFQDSFSIGGELNLSDKPEVLVSSETAMYLAAQRYNIYSGNGWSSDIDETFDSDAVEGKKYEPAMLFRAGQLIILTEPIASNRTPTRALITPLVPDGSVLLTIATYLGADVDSSVKMSWIQLDDASFDLTGNDLSGLPPDLANFAILLRSMTLTDGGGLFGPLSSDAERNRQLETERGALANRFLEVRWEADADGKATNLIVSGQIPVYDDVESVEPKENLPDDGYEVEGSFSSASADDLRGASDNYPDWVLQRYLQLPNTVTPRTDELVRAITSNESTAYGKTKAVESWLRANITYDTSVNVPPDGQDVVDYTLFDNQRGYCEHYATAMTVMLRMIGIPARVASGYAPGEFDTTQNKFVYLQSDAHAWVEVYFPDYGWIPFEPTASEATIPLGEDANGDDSQQPGTDRIATPTEVVEEVPPDPTSTPVAEQEQPMVAQVTTDDSSGGGNGLMYAGIGIAASIVTACVVGWWLWIRRLRGLSLSAGLFARLLRLGRFFGIRPKPSTTPSEYANSLSDRLPVTRGYAQSIVHAYELDQYAERGSDDSVVASAAEAWKHVRSTVAPAMMKKLIPRRLRRRRR